MTSRLEHDPLPSIMSKNGFAPNLRRTVLNWYSVNGRDFPWRQTDSAYQILVAEVLLRQTQAARVRGPFLALIGQYPSATHLAQADLRGLREWFRPLGLVRRADHLIHAAQTLLAKHHGLVPSDRDMLLALPGVGEYAANAILCQAFGARVPMIDEGSGRVLRRVLGIACSRPAYRDRRLACLARSILPRRYVREFNLALVDLADRYCHPRRPDCGACPLGILCSFGMATNAPAKQPENA